MKKSWIDGKSCANCANLIPSHSHPWTDGKQVTESNGFVCIGPLKCGDGFVFNNWYSGGLCELWETKSL